MSCTWLVRLGSGYSRWMFHEARGLPHLQSCLETCPGREALDRRTSNWRNHPGFHKISAQNGPGNGNSLCSMLAKDEKDEKRTNRTIHSASFQLPFSFVGSHFVSTSDIGRSWRWGTDADVVFQNRKAVHLPRQAKMLMRHVCDIWKNQRYHDVQRSYIRAQIGSWDVHGSTSSGIKSGKEWPAGDQQNWKSLRMALSCWSAASMLR